MCTMWYGMCWTVIWDRETHREKTCVCVCVCSWIKMNFLLNYFCYSEDFLIIFSCVSSSVWRLNWPPLSDAIHSPLVCLICSLLTIVHILNGQYLYVSRYIFSSVKMCIQEEANLVKWDCEIKWKVNFSKTWTLFLYWWPSSLMVITTFWPAALF